MQNEAKTTVLAFIDALNKEDFKAAKAQVNDDLTFIGVMGTRNGADAYFADMEKMKLKYEVKKAIAEGEEVGLQYDIDMGGGVTIFAIGWYSLVQGKISTFKVVFDPRALLEKAGR
jgi:predicted ester cyclase